MGPSGPKSELAGPNNSGLGRCPLSTEGNKTPKEVEGRCIQEIKKITAQFLEQVGK